MEITIDLVMVIILIKTGNAEVIAATEIMIGTEIGEIVEIAIANILILEMMIIKDEKDHDLDNKSFKNILFVP